MWRHPKYYAELRKRARKLTSSQATSLSPQARKPKAQASSQNSQAQGSQNQGTSEPSPYPGHKQQE